MAISHTKQDIVDAFNRLIARAELGNITASMIAAEAGIGKATFYRYFKDKYDVMNYNYKQLLDSYLMQCSSYRDLYCQLYLAAQTQLQPLVRAFNSTGINSFENYIYSYSMAIVEEITRENRNGAGYTPEEQMQVDVFCYGISYMYKKWTLGKYSISAEKAADLLYEMMPETLKGYWLLTPAKAE